MAAASRRAAEAGALVPLETDVALVRDGPIEVRRRRKTPHARASNGGQEPEPWALPCLMSSCGCCGGRRSGRGRVPGYAGLRAMVGHALDETSLW